MGSSPFFVLVCIMIPLSPSLVIQSETKWSEESREHKVGVREILRFALDDK